MPTENRAPTFSAVMLLTLVGCGDRAARLPPSAFASPKAVFQQFQRSVESNQWRQAAACLSHDAQRRLATQLYGFALAQKQDNTAVAAAFAELRQRYGLTAVDIDAAGPADTGPGADLATPDLSHVPDLVELIADLARLIEQHSDSESWQAMRSFSFLEPSMGVVRTESDFAVAELLVPGVDLSPPILFERADNQWRIVDLEGRDEQRCPEAAFYHYWSAIQGRHWEKVLPLLDPESQALMLKRANQLADSAVNDDPEASQQREQLQTKFASMEPAQAAAQFAALMTFAEEQLQPQHSLLAFPFSARLGDVTLGAHDVATAPVLTQEAPDPLLTLAFRKVDKRWVLDIRRSNPAKHN